MSDSLFPILETEPLADGIGMLARQARIGGTMTDQQRLTIRAELARRMGCVIENVTSEPSEPIWAVTQKPDWLKLEPIGFYKSNAWSIPDPFTNAADKDALVEWLAADDARWLPFKKELRLEWIASKSSHAANLEYERWLLTLPREAITLAAARALGIQEASNDND